MYDIPPLRCLGGLRTTHVMLDALKLNLTPYLLIDLCQSYVFYEAPKRNGRILHSCLDSAIARGCRLRNRIADGDRCWLQL